MQIHMEQLLRLISQRNRQIIQIKSIDLDIELVSEEQLNSFPSQVKVIYDHFFNGKNNLIDLEKVFPFQVKTTKVPVCNKIFKPTQSIYRCYDCFIHEAAVLCQSCFQSGTHAGHRFQKLQTSGGNCDCGNALALKKQGFCKNHTGSVEVPMIPENQQLLFNVTIENMFKWFFQLQNRKSKNGFYFLNILIKYLIKLNKQSIYYNVLTFHFLTKKTGKNSCYIDEIFKLPQNQVCGSFNELFFNMFSLDQFKIILADRYLHAYNHVINFEKSSFHSLYIQLFANDNVVHDVVKKFNNIFHVQKMNYDYELLLEDLNFISSISEQAATLFYQSFFNKNKYIPYPALDFVQKELQQKGEFHLVDLVSRYIKEQNFFYFTYTEIFKKNKDNQKMLITILQGIFYQMNSSPYSYNKNRAVLPFHRMFALGLFTLFKGNNDQISLEKVAAYLKVEENTVINFYMKSVDQIINCLIDFAETYAVRNYFDNYIILYVRSGVSCGLYDQLFIKQASIIYSKLKLNFEDNIKTKLIERIKSITENKKQQTWMQCFQTWIHLCEILLQISVAPSTQILLNEKLKLNNKCIKDKKSTLFRSLLNKVGSVTKQQFPVLEKFFVEKLDENFLYENCDYNKLTKKYTLRKELIALPFCYGIFLSKKKSGQMIFSESELSEQQMKELNKIYASEKDSILIQTTIPRTILETLTDYTLKSIQQKNITIKQQETILSSLKNLIFKLQIYEKELDKYTSIQQKIRALQPQREENNAENTEEAEKLRLQMLKKRQSEKKSKFLNKQSNIMKLYNEKQHQNLVQRTEQSLICLKCKDEKKNNESLCYFANIKYKKILSAKTKVNKFSFLYTSCFHLIHFSCFREICQDSIRAYCPLCKAASNIVIPVQSKYSQQTFNQSRKRIEGVMKKLKPIQKQENKSSKSELFRSLIECLLEYIGFAGVLNNKQFQKKLLRICKELVSLLSMVYNTQDNDSKQNMKNNLLLTLESKKSVMKNEGESATNGEFEQMKDMTLIYEGIKSCILNVIISAVIDNELISVKNIVDQYYKYLNWEDLSIIIHNLQLVFPNNLLREEDVEVRQNNIYSLYSFYCYYQPPLTMKQVIAQRDSKIIENCKAGHNVCYCTECKQIFCEDCKTISMHCHEHGSESMYLSLLTGSLLIFTPKQIKTLSLYENKFGTSWTPDHDPEGFTLNEQLYKNFVLNLSLHTIEEFLQREKSKIVFYQYGI